jgi:hypothetical protein
VFVNEWLGELIALSYGLAVGNIQALMFGGVEIMLVLFLACAWFARRLGASEKWSATIAAIAATAPACLGLAGVLKGDLLAVAALVMAWGSVSLLRSEYRAAAIVMTVMGLAMAVGAKLSAAPATAATAVVALSLMRPNVSTARAVLLGLALSLPLLSRYLLNFWLFGDPIKRIEPEMPKIGLDSFLGNIQLLASRLVQFGPIHPDGNQFGTLLAGGMGLTLLVVLASICVQFGANVMLSRIRIAALAAAAAGVLILGIITAPAPWGFRYFLPPLLVAAIALLAFDTQKISRAAQAMLVTLGLCIAVLNASVAVWPGEINANRSFRDAVRALTASTFIKRATIVYEAVYPEYALEKFDSEQPMKIAALAAISQGLGPFIGSRAQNQLVLAGDYATLRRIVASQCPNYVVITKDRPEPLADDLRRDVENLGFTWIVDKKIAVAKRVNCNVAVL